MPDILIQAGQTPGSAMRRKTWWQSIDDMVEVSISARPIEKSGVSAAGEGRLWTNDDLPGS